MDSTEETALLPDRIPCSVCGRKFISESLVKHIVVCEKVLCKKRKKFDSAKQRIQGTDLAEFLPIERINRNEIKYIIPKDGSATISKLTNKPEIISSRKNCARNRSLLDKCPNYDRCPHCDRSFGPKAFDRHTEWCKEQINRLNFKSPASQEAKERLEARIKYRAPSFKSRRSVPKECYSSKTHFNDAPNSLKSADRKEGLRKSRSSESLPLKLPEKSKLNIDVNSVYPNSIVDTCNTKLLTKAESKIEKERNNLQCKQTNFSEVQNCINRDGSISVKSTNLSKPVQKRITKTSLFQDCDPFVLAEYQLRALLGDNQSNIEHNVLQSGDPKRRSNFLNYENDKKGDFNKENILNISASRGTTTNCQKKSTTFSISDKFTSEGGQEVNFIKCASPSVDFDLNQQNNILPTIKRPSLLFDYPTLTKKHSPLLSLSNVSSYSSISLEETPDENHDSEIYRSADGYSDSSMEQLDSVNNDEIKETALKDVQTKNKSSNGEKSDHVSYAYESFNDREQRLEKLKNMLDDANSDFINSFSEFENLLRDCYNDNENYVTRSQSFYTKTTESPSFEETKSDISCRSSSRCHLSPSVFKSGTLSNKTSTPDSDISQVSIMSLSIDSNDLSSTRERKLSKFCHECGAKYPLSIAKFCCECGVRRLIIEA